MFWFLTWPDTNQAVQLHKIARGLKFRIWREKGLCSLCSKKTKEAADHEAYLRPCFAYAKGWFSYGTVQV